jgi:endo-beta-N-acetylglucosaminidase D
MYIFAWKWKTTIIFENEKLLCFDFIKSVYGDKPLKDMNEYFKKSDKYMNDYKKIQKIIEDNKLRKLLFSMQNSFVSIIAQNQRNL